MIDSYEKYRQVAKYAGGYFEEQFLELIDRLEASEKEHDALRAKVAEMERQEPVFWWRPCSDGTYEGPLHNNSIERVRKLSGAWSPLYAIPSAQQCKNCNGMGDRFDPSGEKIPCDLCESHLEEIRSLVAEAAHDIISGSDFWLSISLAAKKIYALPGAQSAPSVPELIESLRCACNYIDKLGGVSQQYRAVLASPEANPAPSEQDEPVRKSWARFSHELHRSPDAPYPGMSDAFEQHFSQSFTDREWRAEASTWAAAWKAAKRHCAQPAPSVPEGWIQRGMAELEAIRSRQDDDTLLDDRTLIERIGKAMLAAAPEAKP